ncbi:MAG: O-antigen ligase family protein [Patescibacteria group bacterium]
MHKFQKIIAGLFGILFFLTPLILWPYTSEVFEFNKIIFVYLMTTVITTSWVIRCITENKIIFRRTLLDWPLIIYLVTSLLSTVFSIDIHTSIFGYYSRFNGGLLSIVCYSLLYWAFVSNMNRKSALFTVHCSLFTATLVSLYGILQHFGIDKNIWVQDVQNRIFSTLGQPNWLAAYLVALLPIIYNLKFKIYNYTVAILFFVTLLFTKSRSGLLGFIVADVVFWSILLFRNFKQNLKSFFIFNILFLILFLAVGNPFQNSAAAPALETGGTESGSIRKIVWKGAIDIWKNYPILGTGPETFAYAYYKYRPVEHNLVSEWDFIYNKAHNEYLNLLATTGILGLVSYLFLTGASLITLIKNAKFEFLAGYVGLLISIFFGFSVVPTQLLLFLFPAFAITLND